MDVLCDRFQIVVVDDNVAVLETTCELLARSLPRIWPQRLTPIPIHPTTEAAAGLTLINQTNDGILITDIDLGPTLSGFDLAEAADHLPVIMITGAL
ncbi:MAG: hypothetical protein Q7S64_01645, partial [bacterium]|nr:hypothetical protein [bacterium]